MIITRMVIDMDETRLRTIEQLQEFLRATPEVAFTAPPAGSAADDQRYEHISRVLARFDYPQRNKRERGVVLAYLRRTSGYSRAQLNRLVARWAVNRVAQTPLLKRYRAPAAPFARKYTAGDVALLVEMDRAHEDMCGPAIAHLLQRAHAVYGDPRYERLADLSGLTQRNQDQDGRRAHPQGDGQVGSSARSKCLTSRRRACSIWRVPAEARRRQRGSRIVAMLRVY